MNRIIIRRKLGRYFACFEGPHATRVKNIFGLTDFPTAYLASTPPSYVLNRLQRYENCKVVLSASLQLENR